METPIGSPDLTSTPELETATKPPTNLSKPSEPQPEQPEQPQETPLPPLTTPESPETLLEEPRRVKIEGSITEFAKSNPQAKIKAVWLSEPWEEKPGAGI